MKRGYIRPGFFDEQKLVSKNSAITIKEKQYLIRMQDYGIFMMTWIMKEYKY